MHALKVRRVGPEEHLSLLRVMAQGVRSRLIIYTPDVTERSLERDLMEPIRTLLARGGEVRLLHACEQDAPKALRSLVLDHPRLELLRMSRPLAATVVRGEALALRTLFPVLAHRGRSRPFRDERGWLISDTERVRALVAELPTPSTRGETDQEHPSLSQSSRRRARRAARAATSAVLSSQGRPATRTN